MLFAILPAYLVIINYYDKVGDYFMIKDRKLKSPSSGVNVSNLFIHIADRRDKKNSISIGLMNQSIVYTV